MSTLGNWSNNSIAFSLLLMQSTKKAQNKKTLYIQEKKGYNTGRTKNNNMLKRRVSKGTVPERTAKAESFELEAV